MTGSTTYRYIRGMLITLHRASLLRRQGKVGACLKLISPSVDVKQTGYTLSTT